MRRDFLRLRLSVGVGALLLLPPLTGHALDVNFDANGRIAEEYNTNIFLTPLRHNEVWGQGFDANLNLNLAEQNWGSTLIAAFVNRWYIGEDNIDYNNQLFSTRNFYALSERSQIGFNGEYNMDSTLTTDDVITSDVGFVFRRLHRTRRGITPFWRYALGERTTLTTTYAYQDIVYDKNQNLGGRVVDSLTHTGTIGLEHQLAERLRLTSTALYSEYEIIFPGTTSPGGAPTIRPADNGKIRTASLIGGFEYDIDETLRMGFSGGAQYNEVINPAQELVVDGLSIPLIASTRSSSISELLSARLTKRFQNTDVGFEYSKSLSPNLVGSLISYESYRFYGNYSFTANLSSNLAVGVTNTAGSGGGSDVSVRANQRNLLSLTTGVNWRWAENWNLNGGYQYRQLEFPSSTSEAQGHYLFLNLQYLFDRQQF